MRIVDVLATVCFDLAYYPNDKISSLVLTGNANDDFRLLLDEQYLKQKGVDTLLTRVTTKHSVRRMPKDAEYRDTQTSLFNHTNTFIPNHGDVYSTALLLSGINPSKRGRNERSALPFIVRNT